MTKRDGRVDVTTLFGSRKDGCSMLAGRLLQCMREFNNFVVSTLLFLYQIKLRQFSIMVRFFFWDISAEWDIIWLQRLDTWVQVPCHWSFPCLVPFLRRHLILQGLGWAIATSLYSLPFGKQVFHKVAVYTRVVWITVVLLFNIKGTFTYQH